MQEQRRNPRGRRLRWDTDFEVFANSLVRQFSLWAHSSLFKARAVTYAIVRLAHTGHV